MSRLFEDYQAKIKKAPGYEKLVQQAVEQAYPKQLKPQATFDTVRGFLERKKIELAGFVKFSKEIERIEMGNLNVSQSQAKLEPF